MESQDIKSESAENQPLIFNKELSIWEALFPIFVLIILLSINVVVFEDNATFGPNQFVLILAGAVAARARGDLPGGKGSPGP
jgi:NhaC family Na+:H+ antiporter